MEARIIFGDGEEKKETKDFGSPMSFSTSHIYRLPGTYVATFYVKDNNGAERGGEGDCRKTINVQGVVLAAAPPVQPKAGGEIFILPGLLGLGSLGLWLKKLA